MQRIVSISLSLCLLGLAFVVAGEAQAKGKREAYDIYLTDNRICKQCTAHWPDETDRENVELTNAAGVHAVYPVDEIVGVDKHPVWRRIVRQSIHGNGLAGKVIVPYAFDDAREFVCKYCE